MMDFIGGVLATIAAFIICAIIDEHRRRKALKGSSNEL